MMSGHGGNPIFFNKKIKIGRPEHSLTAPHPPTSDSISFLLASEPGKEHFGFHVLQEEMAFYLELFNLSL